MPVPSWAADAVFYQIFPDRFASGDPDLTPPNAEPWGATPTRHGFQGGDLQGVIDRLDYLVDLGVNALYFNPIFLASSNHRYDTTDYFQVDRKLGRNGTFKALLDAAHARGIRVVLDGVFNHSGRPFFAFADIMENGEHSPYRDWYTVDEFPVNAYCDGDAPNYKAWWDVKSLPKLNTDTPAVREYIFSVVEHWLELGIDGWRLDVPEEIDDPAFWAEFAARVRKVNPEAYTVGEVWEAKPAWVGDRAFHALMNYPLRKAMLAFMAGSEIRAAAFGKAVEALLKLFPEPNTYAQFNLVGSHDTERFLTLAGNDVRRLMLAYSFLFTFVGAPVVYYGDEIGLTGEGDPDCRKAFDWDESNWHRDLHAHVRRLATLRHQHVVLRRGSFARVLAHDRLNVYAFERTLDGVTAVVVLNGADAGRRVNLPATARGWADGTIVTDQLSEARYTVVDGQVPDVLLGPLAAVILMAS